MNFPSLPPTANGQPPTARSAAARQARYRERTEILRGAVEHLREVLTLAADEAGMPHIVPDCDEPTAWLLALAERLDGKALVIFGRKRK